MSQPPVGSGAEHSKNIARGAAIAGAVKDRWLTSLLKGEVKFAILANASYSKGDDRHLETVTLLKILKMRPGWTIATTLQALEQNGFDRKTTIKSIRRSKERIAIFESILATTADRWRGRPTAPPGWPWNGKLSVLVESAGESLPLDFAALFGDDTDDELPQPKVLEEFASFFDEDDE